MKRQTKVLLGVLAAVAVAIVVIVLWPAPDPLKDARTVYVDTGDAQGGRGASELEEGLGFVLNDRDLVLVTNRAEADAVVSVRSVSVNLGDVSVSISQGGISGKVGAACEVTDERTGRTHTT